MINYFDLYKNNFLEYDLIQSYTTTTSWTPETALTYKIKNNQYGFITSFLIRELNNNYSNMKFWIYINDTDVFNLANLVPAYIPLIGGFIPIMRKFNKNDTIKVEFENDNSGYRDFLVWLKLVVYETYK